MNTISCSNSKHKEHSDTKICCCGGHNASNAKRNKHHHGTKNKLSVQLNRKFKELLKDMGY